MRAVLGKKIASVWILKRDAEKAGCGLRPYEVGVLLECEDSSRLLLSFALHDDRDSFSVITPDQILDYLKPQLSVHQQIKS